GQFDGAFTKANALTDCSSLLDDDLTIERIYAFVALLQGEQVQLFTPDALASFDQASEQVGQIWDSANAQFGETDQARTTALTAIAAVPGIIDATLQGTYINVTHETGIRLTIMTKS